MTFSMATILLGFTFGLAYATPSAERGLPGDSLAKRATVICDSNNAVLQALRDPKNSADARTFCEGFIRSITSTTVTATTTRVVSTQTVTNTWVLIQFWQPSSL